MISWSIRLAIGVAFLAALAYFGQIDFGRLSQALSHPWLLLFAAVLIIGSIPLGTVRWQILLIAQQFTLTFATCLRITLIAQFLNTFMPGAYGGDVARLALAYNNTKRRLSRLTLTILIDRISGFISLIILGLLALPDLPLSLRVQSFACLILAILVITGVIVAAFLFSKRVASLVERLPRFGGKIAHAISEVAAAFAIYLERWPALCAAVAISLVQFVLILLSLAVIGSAMEITQLPLLGYMLAGIWSIVANAIPLTPGGIGIGETAFARMASLLEPEPSHAHYASVFLAMRVLLTLVSVIGIFPYLPRRLELRRGIHAIQVGRSPLGTETDGRDRRELM